ncbi:MAG: hypothetical protein ACFFB3_19700, partial [Candidatus Hodarchaeota archaeon]
MLSRGFTQSLPGLGPKGADLARIAVEAPKRNRHLPGKRILALGILLLALAPSAYLAWSWRDMPHLGSFADDSIYWMCAKS